MAPADAADRERAIVEFLQLLARAARQFRTYPATSTLCTEAIDACHRAFVALAIDEPLLVRLTSQQLLVFDEPIATDTAIEQELRRPLYAGRVGSIEFERGASARDWTHFCALVAMIRRTAREGPTFAERLMDAGVSAIVPRMTPRPEVLRLVDSPAPVRHLLNAERARQAAATTTAPAQYLYPPDKGWVRLDPTAEDGSISLTDLTVLVNDPASLASMLARLVDEAVEDGNAAEPLRDRYDDVVTLIGSLEPRLARVLLTKLARSVLDLDVERRRALLRRSILPHLLDGRADAEAVLTEFPDVDLADALGLLFDLEMASPQLLPLALDQLRLPADRRARVVPLVETALGSRSPRAGDRWAAAGFDDQARRLTQVDGASPRRFVEFTAFDLSIDEATRAALAEARDAVGEGDPTEAWLSCVLRLTRIEPNPTAVAALLARAVPVVQGFVRHDRWQDAARWLSRIADVASQVDTSRPDVAAAVRDALARFCDRETLLRLAALCGTETGKAYAPLLVAALGRSVVPAWLDALASPPHRAVAIRLRPVLCECAVMTASSIAARLPQLRSDVAVAAVGVLGFAGGGYEDAIAATIDGEDEALAREALRALARIASPKAATLIAAHVENGGAIQPVAEEALWRLPAPLALTRARELLARRDFVGRYPHAAARLLERAAHGGDAALEPILETLAPLRFHFWNPAVARVGARARDLM